MYGICRYQKTNNHQDQEVVSTPCFCTEGKTSICPITQQGRRCPPGRSRRRSERIRHGLKGSRLHFCLLAPRNNSRQRRNFYQVVQASRQGGPPESQAARLWPQRATTKSVVAWIHECFNASAGRMRHRPAPRKVVQNMDRGGGRARTSRASNDCQPAILH